MIKINDLPKLKSVKTGADSIAFLLDTGQSIYIPLEWSEKLLNATDDQRINVIVSDYYAIWDDVDEIIGVKNILYGDRLYLCLP